MTAQLLIIICIVVSLLSHFTISLVRMFESDSFESEQLC